MIAKIEGKLVDKYTRDRKSNDGKEYQTYHAVIYQRDNKQTTTIGIDPETFNQVEREQDVEIICNISAFLGNNNSVIQYAKEITK